MVIKDPAKWAKETKTIKLPSGLTVKIRRIPTTAFLQLLDLGEVATQKPSEVAKIIVPACLVEPKLSLDDIPPFDVLQLLDEIVKFSELDKMPFRAEVREADAGAGRKGVREKAK